MQPTGPDATASSSCSKCARSASRPTSIAPVYLPRADVPEEKKAEAGKIFSALKEKIFRDEMLDARRRPDGRKFDEIREIWGEAGVLPRTHGSALFTRGETQALVTVTLGTKDDEQRVSPLVQPHVEMGKPGWVLVSLASRSDDVLVIGAGRRGILARIVFSRVSRHCLAHAQCPVLAVPPPELRRGRLRWTFRHRPLTVEQLLQWQVSSTPGRSWMTRSRHRLSCSVVARVSEVMLRIR